MNPGLVLIISLKYSPVHNTHCRAIGEPLRSLGNDVKYLLPCSLKWTVPQAQLKHVLFMGSSRNPLEVIWDTLAIATWRRGDLASFLQDTHPSIVLFESPHPANVLIAGKACSIVGDVRLWMLLHEPYVPEKSRHGWLRSFLIAAQELGVRQLMGRLDGILLPSDEAIRQMNVAYPDFGGTILKVPLLFEDRYEKGNILRSYFSFIGHAVRAKGIDTFFRIVEQSAKSAPKWRFLIATSTDISGYLRRLSRGARSRLDVVMDPKLPDAQIDEAIRQSWAVLAPYRRVTQSGVVPVAFMHGTPVISTNLGAMPETVFPGETGYLVNEGAPFSEWEEKFDLVRNDFPRLSANCRDFFLQNFDSERAPEFLRPMLSSVDWGD